MLIKLVVIKPCDGFVFRLFSVLGIIFWLNAAVAAPVPEGTLFWVAYSDMGDGNGDRMMAEKLAERIRRLGYQAGQM